jgi:hypothetical protein
MCDRVVSFWTSDTGLRDVVLALAVARSPFPEPSDSGSFRPGPGSPSEFLTTSRPSDPSVGSDSPEVSAPYDDVTRTSPCWSEDVHPRSGSTRRFSQPPGGFTAGPGLRPCFMPLPSLGYLSLQSFPSQGSLHPSRGRLLPYGHPRAPCVRRSRSYHHGFRRRSRHLWRVCRFPPAAMGSLSTDHPWLGGLPVTLDHARRTHARPHGSPVAKP